ncbi:MAG: radical SAM protein [Candidatus Omnitrophica bacterium]|nr:radical SAM protein [Candidatus Omnitrophota bacterium]
MALYYLASYLESRGHDVQVFDASLGPILKIGNVYRYGLSSEEVDIFLKGQSFDLAGISCSFTARWPFVKKMAIQLKELFPKVPVIVGGLFPTYAWEECLQTTSAVDAIILGEGEKSFALLADGLQHGKSFNDACREVDGISWRESDGFRTNSKNLYIDNLDSLPFPAWHLADLSRYFRLQKNIFELSSPCLPILSSRSCPFSCTFCNMYITHGKRWRARSAENVLEEIQYLVTKFNVRRFYFVDDNFSIDLKRAKAICQGIIDRKLEIKYNFHNGLSIKTIDRDLVALLKKSGCTSVCLAIESGSDRVRNTIYRKGLSLKKIIDVVDWFYREGIPTIGYFMVGAPGETKEDINMSRDLISKLPLTLITVGIYTPYPQTELYDECKKQGWIVNTDSENACRVEMFSPMLHTSDFKPSDVSLWQKDLYLTFIKYHWRQLFREFFRSSGVVNVDMICKFLGMIRFRAF